MLPILVEVFVINQCRYLDWATSCYSETLTRQLHNSSRLTILSKNQGNVTVHACRVFQATSKLSSEMS